MMERCFHADRSCHRYIGSWGVREGISCKYKTPIVLGNPTFSRGPHSFYIQILTSPWKWKGGGGGRWLADTFSVQQLDHGISCLPRLIVVHFPSIFYILVFLRWESWVLWGCRGGPLSQNPEVVVSQNGREACPRRPQKILIIISGGGGDFGKLWVWVGQITRLVQNSLA